MDTKVRDRVAVAIIMVLFPIIIAWGVMMLNTYGN